MRFDDVDRPWITVGARKDALRALATAMTGNFTSAEQAKADPDFKVIHLHIAPIWTERTDGPWLYMEQAAASSLDKPYRQRIYHLHAREFCGYGVRFPGVGGGQL